MGCPEEKTNNTPSTPPQNPSNSFEKAYRKGHGEYPAIPEVPVSKRTIRPRPKTQEEIS